MSKFSDLLNQELPSKRSGFDDALFGEASDDGMGDFGSDEKDFEKELDSAAEEGSDNTDDVLADDDDEMNESFFDDDPYSSDESFYEGVYERDTYKQVKGDFDALKKRMISANNARCHRKFAEAIRIGESGKKEVSDLESKINGLDIKKNKPLLSSIFSAWYGFRSGIKKTSDTATKGKYRSGIANTISWGVSDNSTTYSVERERNVEYAELTSREVTKIKAELKKLCVSLKSDFDKIIALAKKENDMDFDVTYTDAEKNAFNGRMLNRAAKKSFNEDADDLLSDEAFTEVAYFSSKNEEIDSDLRDLAKEAKFTSFENDKAVDFLRRNKSKISKVTAALKKDAKDIRKETMKDLLACLVLLIPFAGYFIFLIVGIVRTVIQHKRNVNYKDYINNLSSVKRSLQRIDKSKLKREDAITVEEMLSDIADAEDDWRAKIIREGAEDLLTDPEEMDGLTDNEIDDDEMNDEELEREVSDADIEDIAGIDDLDEEDLTPEEEMEANNLMQLAATTTLINNEMNPEERVAFAESDIDAITAVNEGFLLESDIEEFESYAHPFTEGKVWTKTKVQFNKDARMAQLHAVAVNVCAQSKNDPDYIKLKKLNRMRKVLRARLNKKYGAAANRLTRVYFQRLKQSKSPALQQIAKKNERAVKEATEIESAGANGAAKRFYDARVEMSQKAVDKDKAKEEQYKKAGYGDKYDSGRAYVNEIHLDSNKNLAKLYDTKNKRMSGMERELAAKDSKNPPTTTSYGEAFHRNDEKNAEKAKLHNRINNRVK